jgi:isochorismate synthase
MNQPDDFMLLGPDRRLRASGVLAQLPAELATGRAAAGHAMDLLRATEARTGRAGVLVGAIPFDTTRPARLVVPNRVHWDDVGPTGPDVAPADRDTQRRAEFEHDDPEYRTAVAAALRGIDAGMVDKVVLARTVDLRLAHDLDPAVLVAELARTNRDGYTFRADVGGGQVLVGASPELLAAVDGDRLVSYPLAGTTTRHADPAEDRVAATELLASAKNVDEHRMLVDALCAGLGPVAGTLDIPAGPGLVATERLWHLGTRITGRIRPGLSVLDVAYAVHPTPAVCGTPARAAGDLIRLLEPVDRDFYAGLVGWMDSSGQGEWVLALRCARLDGRDIRLYAGAGVVAGSDPVGEHAETAAKLQTALAALTTVADVRGSDELAVTR